MVTAIRIPLNLTYLQYLLKSIKIIPAQRRILEPGKLLLFELRFAFNPILGLVRDKVFI